EAAEFTLALRIPGWCRGATLKVNGKAVGAGRLTRKGYARIKRVWRKGDKVELRLPMPVERIEAHPKVRANAGRVALQRGPIVYCLEEVDNGPNLSDIALPRTARLRAEYDEKLLGGVVVVTGKARRRDASAWRNRLYGPSASRTRSVTIKAVPYCAWANRRPGEMLVWVREA
ncbi:MAG: glycoside hydrolase family 127 protein, partial [Candidatus Brocadiae bacterium]|nr:glycoside hydrolase family 127 protein [Candidatus Brocadiia bacterium]